MIMCWMCSLFVEGELRFTNVKNRVKKGHLKVNDL